MKVTPMLSGNVSSGNAEALRPQIQVHTRNSSPTIEKLKAKLAAEGHNQYHTPQPMNKQGEAIPPQPSGVKQDAPKASEAPALAQSNSSVEAPKPAEAPKEQPLSPQHAQLAQQQRALRKAQQELKAAQEAWKQEQAKFISKETLLSNPLATLTEAGVSYDKLVEQTLNQADPDPNLELRQELAAVKAELAKVTGTFESRDKQAYDQAVNQIRSDAKLLVESDPAFEVTKATGQSEEVVKLIQKVFEAEGTILSVEEAAQAVEAELVEQEVKRLEKLSSLQKIKAKLAPPPAEVKEPEEAKKQSTPSLTNAMGVSRPLTSRERAILAFEEASKKRS